MIDRFKVVAHKEIIKIPNIVENLIRRYVENRFSFFENKFILVELHISYLINQMLYIQIHFH